MQLDLLTSSQEGIPASHSVLLGGDEARAMTAISGRTLLGLYENSGRLTWWLRTLLGTSAWGSTRCWLTWKDSATPAGRLLFRLVPSMPRTAEIGSGLLATPTTKANQMCPSMQKWPSCALWPTPGAADNRDRGHLGMPAIQRRAAKGKQLNLGMVVSDQSGALNPEWVEWLMGYPIGWTDCEPSETPSSRRSRKRSSGQ